MSRAEFIKAWHELKASGATSRARLSRKQEGNAERNAAKLFIPAYLHAPMKQGYMRVFMPSSPHLVAQRCELPKRCTGSVNRATTPGMQDAQANPAFKPKRLGRPRRQA